MILSWELIKDKAVYFTGAPYQFKTQCQVTSNPYGGATGTYGLLNCIAIQNGGLWSVIRLNWQPNAYGNLLGFQNGPAYQYSSNGDDWLNVNNGYVYLSDIFGTAGWYQVRLGLSVGWHTIIAGEYYSGGTYYLFLAMDTPSNYATFSFARTTTLFGYSGPYPYSIIGAMSSNFGVGGVTSMGFVGPVQYIAIYGGNSPSIQSTLLQWLQQTGGKSLPPIISGSGPYALFIPIGLSSNGVIWRDMSGNGNDVELAFSGAPSTPIPNYLVLLRGE